MLKRFRDRFIYRLLLFICNRRYLNSGSCSVGNRYIRQFPLGPLDVTITFRDTRKPDGYCREELLQMMELIRREEARQEWSVPDKKTQALEKALRSTFEKLDALIADSRGVADLHQNGDLADWQWLQDHDWLDLTEEREVLDPESVRG